MNIEQTLPIFHDEFSEFVDTIDYLEWPTLSGDSTHYSHQYTLFDEASLEQIRREIDRARIAFNSMYTSDVDYYQRIVHGRWGDIDVEREEVIVVKRSGDV